MPIENELKYVLKLDLPENSFLYDSKSILKQYYLYNNVRLRHSNLDNSYIFCFKQPYKDNYLEIETKIDKSDFDILSSTASVSLSKIRYTINYGNLKWEIDFFKKKNETYFVMAEHEMPEEQDTPKFIPDLITANQIFAVPKDDKRFSSKKLADVYYARNLYKSLFLI